MRVSGNAYVEAHNGPILIAGHASPVAAPVIQSLDGALPAFGHLREMQRDALGLYVRAMRTGADACELRIGASPALILNAPEAIRAMLVDHANAFEKGAFVDGIRPLVGDGLLSAANVNHRKHRALVAPAFHPHRISAFATIMASYARDMVCMWLDRSIVDINAEMMRLTLRIVGKTLFDADVAQEAATVGAALSFALEFISKRQMQLVKAPLHWPLPAHRRFHRSLQTLDQVLGDIIRERRAMPADRGDLLSMLLAAQDEHDGTGLSDLEVRDEAMTIFLAGHETTANALSWALYLLTRHPQAWLALREEVVTVLDGRTPTLADAALLRYTAAVFKETLRLYPPAYVFGRQAVCDIRVGRVDVAQGQLVAVSPYALHRNPEFFRAPEAFMPERFLPEYEAGLNKHAYLPFGGGPRVCIGNNFAIMEGQLILASIAQHVKLEALSDRLLPDPQVTLHPAGGFPARVHRL